MPNLQYSGSITAKPYNGASAGTSNNTVSLNFNTSQINWTSGTNSNLLGGTLSNLTTDPLYTITYNVSVKGSGLQYYDDSSYPTMNFQINANDGSNVSKQYGSFCPGSLGTGSYSINDNFSMSSYPTQIQISSFNKCHSGLPGCANHTAYDINIEIILYIQLIANCTGSYLNNEFCSEYCLTNANSCVNDYIGYCMPNGNSTMPLLTNQSCQNFITNYIEQNGPLSQIDTPLSEYCQSKYSGFGDLFASTNELDTQLCACHMPAIQYANFENELFTNYPTLKNLGWVDECLLPQCASSQYKSTTTTGKCNLPLCLNIAEFNNDGSFNNSTVNINQGNNCTNITPNPTPTTPIPTNPNPTINPTPVPSSYPYPTPTHSPSKGFFNKYKYYIIGLSVLIVALIFVFVIFKIIHKHQINNTVSLSKNNNI